MTKIIIKATDEEFGRLDYIGLFEARAAGILYEHIEITSCEEGEAKVLGKKIKQKCDRINSLASELSYPEQREIQELLCEIMDLCKADGGKE